MEIHALKLMLAEDDLNAACAQFLPRDGPLRQVQVRITPGGLRITGAYSLVVGVPFETLWELSVRGGKLAARLASVRVIGWGTGMLNGILMKALNEAATREDALQVQGDTLLLDLDRLLVKRGLASRTNLTAVRCEDRRLWIEASNQP
jgi:hypothetical protein